MKKEITREEALEWIAQMHMNKEECKEQIQEDVIAYMDACIVANGIDPVLGQTILEDTCQIVVDNFKKLED